MTSQHHTIRHCMEGLLVLAILAVLISRAQVTSVPEELKTPGSTAPQVAPGSSAETTKANPFSLFDGKSLAGWKLSEFGGDGDVRVEDGQLILGFGEALTGVTWDQAPEGTNFQLPRDNYEVNLDAMRVDGSDFFCGLTFPVGDDPCSLILGGWGGGVVGLSSINLMDASENETTQFFEFKNKKWYHVRVRVTTAKIEAWIDGKQLIEVERDGNEFSVRVEVELSRPLGIASWQTTAALRNITMLSLAAEQPE